MPVPTEYQFDLTGTRPERVELPREIYPGVREFWLGCTSTRRYNPVTGIRAIVIHATAGGSSDGALWGMRNGKSSFHWLIPDEDEAAHENFIWSTVPEELAAWHVVNSAHSPDVWENNKLINHWSIGVELVNNQNTSDEFSDWQLKMAAKIVKYSWMKYPNLKHVVSHAKLDPGRRTDPGPLFDWPRFKALVLDGADDAIPQIFNTVTPIRDIIQTDHLCCGG